MKGVVITLMVFFALAILYLQRRERSELMMAFVASGALGAVVFKNLERGDTSTFWFLPAVALPVTAFLITAVIQDRRTKKN